MWRSGLESKPEVFCHHSIHHLKLGNVGHSAIEELSRMTLVDIEKDNKVLQKLRITS